MFDLKLHGIILFRYASNEYPIYFKSKHLSTLRRSLNLSQTRCIYQLKTQSAILTAIIVCT
ncbi:hypothetical protein Hanom_Chr04g00379951 [Helianthus anomalus]